MIGFNRERILDIIGTFPEQKQKVLVVGDVGIDKYTYGNVKRISPEAPVPVLEVTKEWEKLGLASNVGDNLKSLKINSLLCSVIGDDRQGTILRNLMRENQLSEEGLLVLNERKTTMKERVLTKTQQVCRVDYETLGDLSSEEGQLFTAKIETLSNDYDLLIIEDYGKGLMTEIVSKKVINLFLDQGKKVLVDPSRKTPPHFYHGVTLLKPNREESEILAAQFGYKGKNIEKTANLLIEKLNLEKIVITLGEEGMGLIDTKNGGHYEVIPTFAREVYDVSGAGDTAISALSASLISGASLKESVLIANGASSVVVGKRGTDICSYDELNNFFKNSLI